MRVDRAGKVERLQELLNSNKRNLSCRAEHFLLFLTKCSMHLGPKYTRGLNLHAGPKISVDLTHFVEL